MYSCLYSLTNTHTHTDTYSLHSPCLCICISASTFVSVSVSAQLSVNVVSFPSQGVKVDIQPFTGSVHFSFSSISVRSLRFFDASLMCVCVFYFFFRSFTLHLLRARRVIFRVCWNLSATQSECQCRPHPSKIEYDLGPVLFLFDGFAAFSA